MLRVLILVLMEDALRDRPLRRQERLLSVLILVLMEDALRGTCNVVSPTSDGGLNPCSNGRCSARSSILAILANPKGVLILVLMEDALRASPLRACIQAPQVLILVLMEDALRATKPIWFGGRFISLNPCSNGRCSASGILS